MPTAQELLDKRNTCLSNMRVILDKAKTENRDLSAEERSQCDKWETEFNSIDTEYKLKQKDSSRSSWLTEREQELSNPAGQRRTQLTNPSDNQTPQSKLITWNSMEGCGGTERSRSHNVRKIRMRGSYQQRQERFSYELLPDVMKDLAPPEWQSTTLQSDDEPRAGYLAPSETFMEGLLKNVDDETWIWKNSRVIVIPKARSLGIRKLTTKMSSWAKGAELSDATDNLDESLAFGKKNLTPAYFTGSTRLSRDLIRSSVEDIESLVYSEFARDLSYVIENEDINGDGNGGPLGVMVASSDGISTSRDISDDTTTTTFKPEHFYDCKYKLKTQYRNKARWMFHREVIRDIMKLRDLAGGAGTGTFLMQPALRAGEPDTLLGLPVDENEFFPNTRAASQYFGLLAVWNYYVHAIALDMEILRLDQTRAKTNEIEYVGRVKLDGMPILEEAFVRCKFAAS